MPTGQLRALVPGGWKESSLSSPPEWTEKGELEAMPVNVLDEAQHWQVCSIMWTDGTGREAQFGVFFMVNFGNGTHFVLLRL